MLRVNFMCEVCSNEFYINSDRLRLKDSVVCPSCGIELPKDVLSDLKSGLSSIAKADEENRHAPLTPVGPGGKIVFTVDRV